MTVLDKTYNEKLKLTILRAVTEQKKTFGKIKNEVEKIQLKGT